MAHKSRPSRGRRPDSRLPPGHDDWIAALHAGGCSQHTVRLYGMTVRRAWLEGAFADRGAPSRWIAAHPDWTPATRSTYSKALRSYLRTVRRLDVAHAPAVRPKDVVRTKVPTAVPKALSDAEVLRLLGENMPDRTRLWLFVALLAGLRAGEIAQMRAEDIDLSAATIRVRGKGGKARVVAMHEQLRPHMAALTEAIPSGPLWPNVSPAAVSAASGRLFRRAGLPGGIHRCRHWHATTLLRTGADIRQVQDALGHAGLNTTQSYLAVHPDALGVSVGRLTLPAAV